MPPVSHVPVGHVRQSFEALPLHVAQSDAQVVLRGGTVGAQRHVVLEYAYVVPS
jgi:hypothetical protein